MAKLITSKLVYGNPDAAGRRIRHLNKFWVDHKPGDVVTVRASAPGSGYIVYQVTKKDDEGLYGKVLENTIRILHPSEVV